MSKSVLIFKVLKLLGQTTALFFLIPSLLLFAVGCYFIVPSTLNPLIRNDEFRGGQLYVDSVNFSGGDEGGRPTMYSLGHINGNKNKIYELTIDSDEINPHDAYEGNEISVYYHPEFQEVYFRKDNESLTYMDVNKVLNPFLFWSVTTILPFPIFFYIYLRYRREKKIEKLQKAANPRERWVE